MSRARQVDLVRSGKPRFLWAVFAVFFVSLAGVSSADARSPEAAEKADLVKTVAAFNDAMSKADYAAVIGAVPQKIMNSIATKADLPIEKMREMVVEATKAVMTDENVKMVSFSMDVDKAEYKELKNGQPYALVPTKTVMDLKDQGQMAQTSHTLAFIDDGKWQLVRVSEVKMMMILREIYPEFVGVEFPRGSMEMLKK